jgi:hypothetical protein
MQPAALNNKVQLPVVTLSSQPELNSSKTEEGEQKAKNHKAECKAKKRNRKAKGLELIKNRK